MAEEDPAPYMSASEKLSHQLSLGRARQLEQWGSDVIPQIFENLVVEDRKVLLEVVSSSPSILSATIQSVAGRTEAASQCGKHDKCDLGTSEGVALVVNRIRLEKPRHV